jgi:hypothetical protein
MLYSIVQHKKESPSLRSGCPDSAKYIWKARLKFLCVLEHVLAGRTAWKFFLFYILGIGPNIPSGELLPVIASHRYLI